METSRFHCHRSFTLPFPFYGPAWGCHYLPSICSSNSCSTICQLKSARANHILTHAWYFTQYPVPAYQVLSHVYVIDCTILAPKTVVGLVLAWHKILLFGDVTILAHGQNHVAHGHERHKSLQTVECGLSLLFLQFVHSPQRHRHPQCPSWLCILDVYTLQDTNYMGGHKLPYPVAW